MVQDGRARGEDFGLRPAAQAIRRADARGRGQAAGVASAGGNAQGAVGPRGGGVFGEGERLGQACRCRGLRQ